MPFDGRSAPVPAPIPAPAPVPAPVPTYAELQVTTNFSFLRGGSHPEELVMRAAELGYRAIGIADRNTLAGVVRAHGAAKRAGVKLLVGARLDLQDGPSLLCFPQDKPAYARLSSLLTLGKRRAGKGDCHILGSATCRTMPRASASSRCRPTAFRNALPRTRAPANDDFLSVSQADSRCFSGQYPGSRRAACTAATIARRLDRLAGLAAAAGRAAGGGQRRPLPHSGAPAAAGTC